MNSPLIAEILLEIGTLKVFHYATLEEINAKTPYKSVFWQEGTSGGSWGPFPSIHEALAHHNVTKANKVYVPAPTNVISVDFKLKKRISG